MGHYEMLKEPYCGICAAPQVDTNTCYNDHKNDFFDKVNSIGIYYQKDFHKNDLLSEHILKLKNDKDYAEPLGKSMAIIAKEKCTSILDCDGIVPMPLYVSEFYLRGFNQALELSKVIKRETQLPIIWALEKTRMHSQRDRRGADRRKSVEGLYKVKNPDFVKDKKLVIVDDVFTSGGYCSESAKVLKEAKAKDVQVFVAGRSNFVRGTNH
jgi:competence protein ComFC